MIVRFAGWASQRRQHELVLATSTPDLNATFRYVERCRPLATLDDIVRQRIAPTVRDWAAEQPERFVTREGEHCAFVRGVGSRDGTPISWCVAIVLADDFYSYLEGFAPLAHAPRLQEVSRELAMTEEFQLGTRKRRYVFSPPTSWIGLVIGDGISHYFPDDYPLFDARISVFPAVPFTASSPPILDLQRILGEHVLVRTPGASAGFVVTRRSECEFASASGLTGVQRILEGRWPGHDVIRDFVVMRDEGYAYAVELSTRPDVRPRAIELFLNLARSIEPIPATNSTTTRSRSSPFTHFAE